MKCYVPFMKSCIIYKNSFVHVFHLYFLTTITELINKSACPDSSRYCAARDIHVQVLQKHQPTVNLNMY